MSPRRIVKTVYRIRDIIEPYGPWDPLDLFEQNPLLEVRQECLVEMGENYNVDSNKATQFEECFGDIYYHDEWDLAAGIMAKYLCAKKDEEIEIRAIDFALEFVKNPEISERAPGHQRSVLNMVFRKIEENPSLYPKVASFQAHIRGLISGFSSMVMSCGRPPYHYSDFEWRPVEKSLEMVARMKDQSFFKELDGLKEFFEKYFPYYSSTKSPLDTAHIHLAKVKEAKVAMVVTWR